MIIDCQFPLAPFLSINYSPSSAIIAASASNILSSPLSRAGDQKYRKKKKEIQNGSSR